ncbi:unnamed protein product [Bursaphelenchus okinawaensis]|uniref:Uncharacterized protein n=1 Tax=Bursaphelenchus okinawaensis TaxID=465554 RepID=A0A811KD91_9BILA|nr:unnamed protein product [Bursaphelenchus okinawaensis]CAG9101525.1 unnamed protein product [Bursaphelenchus okinawaensis]
MSRTDFIILVDIPETSPSSRHYRPYQNSQYPQQQQPALNPNFQEFPYADRRASLSRQYSGDTDYFQLIDDLINEDRQSGDNPSVLKNELESTHSVQPEQRIPEQPSGRSAYFRHERESMKPSTSTSKTPKEEPGPSGTALVRAAALKLEPESSNAFKLLMNQQQVAGNAYNTLLGRYGLAVVW